MRNLLTVTGMMVALLLSMQLACTSDMLEEPVIPEICDVEQPTYTSHMKAIIENSCAYSTCHDGAGGAPGNFLSYAGLQPYFDEKLNLRVIMDKNMPPSFAPRATSLTDEELELFTCWASSEFPE